LTSCGNSVDHCVQLTGYMAYGSSGSYWVVRNSWGTDWGENGFIWIAIGQDLCSIGDYATVVADVISYASVEGETGLYKQASTAGPVSVCVDASSWSGYSGGILTSCGNSVDHCVQLTGYANYGGSQAYWIVRNSWGTDWGENGFIWIAIGQDLCYIGDYATVVADKSG